MLKYSKLSRYKVLIIIECLYISKLSLELEKSTGPILSIKLEDDDIEK
jgi:hypothetical protein